MTPAAIVPAAGRAERFGGGKLLARIDGEALLDRTLHSLLDAGLDRVVVVTARGADLDAAGVLADPRVTRVVNPDPSRGMFSSIQAGLAAVDGDPLLVLPGDMPFVSPATIAGLVSACVARRSVIVPAHGGRRGHPVAFPGPLREDLLREPAGSSLKAALTATGIGWIELPVGDAGVLRDVDVPEDLDR